MVRDDSGFPRAELKQMLGVKPADPESDAAAADALSRHKQMHGVTQADSETATAAVNAVSRQQKHGVKPADSETAAAAVDAASRQQTPGKEPDNRSAGTAVDLTRPKQTCGDKQPNSPTDAASVLDRIQETPDNKLIDFNATNASALTRFEQMSGEKPTGTVHETPSVRSKHPQTLAKPGGVDRLKQLLADEQQQEAERKHSQGLRDYVRQDSKNGVEAGTPCVGEADPRKQEAGHNPSPSE